MTFVGPFQLRVSYDSMNKGQKALIVGECLFLVIIEGLVCVQPPLECTVAVPRHTWSVLVDQPAFPFPPACPGKVSLLLFPWWWQFAVRLDHGKWLPWFFSRFLSQQRGSDKQEVLTTCRVLGWRVSKQTSLVRGLCGQTSCRVPAGSQRQLAVPGLVDFLLGNGKRRQEWGVF